MLLSTRQDSVPLRVQLLVRQWPRRTRVLFCSFLLAVFLFVSVNLFRDSTEPISIADLSYYHHDNRRPSSTRPSHSVIVDHRLVAHVPPAQPPLKTTPKPSLTSDPKLKTYEKSEQKPEEKSPGQSGMLKGAHFSLPDKSEQVSIPTLSHATKVAPTLKKAPQETKVHQPAAAGSGQQASGSPTDDHPISRLLEDAKRQQEAILAFQTFTLPYAAEAYRKRRGRHPPPRFAAWFEFASARNVVMVEEFWDLIYDDLKPFWAVDAGRLRRQAASGSSIRVRDGRIHWKHDFFWCRSTAGMIEHFVKDLPDLDISMNLMDEPRVIVPWEKISQLVQKEGQLRVGALDVPLQDMRETFQRTVSEENGNDSADRTESMQAGWQSQTPGAESYWPLVTQGCPADSPSRLAYNAHRSRRTGNSTDIPTRPVDMIDLEAVSKRKYAKQGFIQNYTAVVDICEQPELEFLHGAIVQPLTTSHRGDLLPLFSGSKMSVNNDITLPAPMHYVKADNFVDESRDPSRKTDDLWPNMLDEIMWRGTTSGGAVTTRNWKAFHRHRFLALTHPDQLGLYDEGVTPETWLTLNDTSLPAIKQADMQAAVSRAAADHTLKETFGHHLLAAFTDNPCTRATTDPATGDCAVGRASMLGDRLSLAQQFRHKYLPDLDGNSYSGRFRGFLMSDAVPIKATIYREWFDRRILPWVHFVPMSNTFHEFYAIMEYFLGYQAKNGDVLPPHDAQAKWIAKQGREWSERVLRKEDQEVYMFRLLLEYARILDDDRDHLGYVDDLL